MITIKKAQVELVAHLKEIRTVQEWAEWMGFKSAKQFSKQFCKYFGFRPQKSLVEIRLSCIVEVVVLNPELSGYEIAWEVGLRDEKALYNFLVRHSGTSLTELRNAISVYNDTKFPGKKRVIK